jgi:hypothetical protein
MERRDFIKQSPVKVDTSGADFASPISALTNNPLTAFEIRFAVERQAFSIGKVSDTPSACSEFKFATSIAKPERTVMRSVPRTILETVHEEPKGRVTLSNGHSAFVIESPSTAVKLMTLNSVPSGKS